VRGEKGHALCARGSLVYASRVPRSLRLFFFVAVMFLIATADCALGRCGWWFRRHYRRRLGPHGIGACGRLPRRE